MTKREREYQQKRRIVKQVREWGKQGYHGAVINKDGSLTPITAGMITDIDEWNRSPFSRDRWYAMPELVRVG